MGRIFKIYIFRQVVFVGTKWGLRSRARMPDLSLKEFFFCPSRNHAAEAGLKLFFLASRSRAC